MAVPDRIDGVVRKVGSVPIFDAEYDEEVGMLGYHRNCSIGRRVVDLSIGRFYSIVYRRSSLQSSLRTMRV